MSDREDLRDENLPGAEANIEEPFLDDNEPDMMDKWIKNFDDLMKDPIEFSKLLLMGRAYEQMANANEINDICEEAHQIYRPLKQTMDRYTIKEEILVRPTETRNDNVLQPVHKTEIKKQQTSYKTSTPKPVTEPERPVRRPRRQSQSSSDEETSPNRDGMIGTGARRKTQPQTKRSKGNITAEDLVDALRDMALHQTRKVPEPGAFSIESGKSFCDFRERFERYCSCQYSGNKDDWVYPLEKFLTGQIKNVYLSIREGTNQYFPLMCELEEWYTRRKKILVIDQKAIVRNMTMMHGESMDAYVTRLEGAARAAYGHQFAKYARRRLLETAPESFRQTLSTENWRSQITNDCELPWSHIQDLAAITSLKWKSKSGKPGQQQDYSTVGTMAMDSQPNKPVNKQRTWQPQDYKQKSGLTQCTSCGKTGHKYENCRKRLGLCYKCGQPGHMTGNCPQRKTESTCPKSGNRQNRSSQRDMETQTQDNPSGLNY